MGAVISQTRERHRRRAVPYGDCLHGVGGLKFSEVEERRFEAHEFSSSNFSVARQRLSAGTNRTWSRISVAAGFGNVLDVRARIQCVGMHHGDSPTLLSNREFVALSRLSLSL